MHDALGLQFLLQFELIETRLLAINTLLESYLITFN